MNVCSCSASPQNMPGSRRFDTSVLALPSTIWKSVAIRVNFIPIALTKVWVIAFGYRNLAPEDIRHYNALHSRLCQFWIFWIAAATPNPEAHRENSENGMCTAMADIDLHSSAPAKKHLRKYRRFYCNDLWTHHPNHFPLFHSRYLKSINQNGVINLSIACWAIVRWAPFGKCTNLVSAAMVERWRRHRCSARMRCKYSKLILNQQCAPVVSNTVSYGWAFAYFTGLRIMR